MPESIAEFIAKLEKLNFSLVVEERKLILKGDKKKLSKEEIQAIRSNQEIISFIVKNKEELIEYLSQFSSEKKTKDISSLYRLSSLQQGILFHSLYYDKDSGAYIKTFNCDLSGVNPEFFEMAWNFLVKRHSILRTAFYHDTFNIPVQSVFKDVYLPVAWHDCRNLNSQEQKDFISNLNATEMADGFDLKKPPLMRLSMIRMNDLKYHLMWKWHDILFDGWSLPVLMEEFLTTYELLASGKKIVEQDEDLYEDYIKYIDRTDKEQSKQYWQKYLDGLNQGTLLPFVESTAERNKGLGKYKTVSLQISTAFTSKIQTFAQKHHITVNTVMQGVWSILLHEYTGNQDIAFGVIVSGRPDDLPGVEKRVGMFINNLPLRSKFDGNESASAWLKNLQSEQVLSRKNQHTPLTDIQNWSGISGDIFDSILVYENYPVNKIIHAKQWRLLVDNIEIHEQTNYPMTLLVSGIEQLSVDFSYNSGLMDEYYVKQISRHFENVLHQIIKKEHTKLSDIDLITASESEQLLETFNQTKKSYPQDQTIVELFEQQVKRTPQAIAIIFEDQTLSYQELNEKSNQLAHYLKAKGVKPETLVPICLERSVEMMIGILGILKSGGAYVPIDPQYPQDRMAYMLNDCNSAFLLTTEKHTIKTQNVIQQINLKTSWKQIESYPNTNLKSEAKLKNLAYVIYTSGSTGKPKGVMNQHSGLLNRLLWAQDYYKLSVEDKVLQKTTFSFDVSVWELLWPLITGSQLIFAKPEGHKDQQYLKQIIEDQKITMLHFVPSMLEVFLTDINPLECTSLKKVLTSGEALKPSQVKLFKEKLPGTELHNLYGPTEAAIDVTYWSVPEKKKKIKLVPIGKPVSNTQILILNSSNKLVPVGCEGEIHIGGVQVARGYLNNETLTKEKFITNPFDKNRRLYKTGDKGRWLSDGNIEYLGRIDDQLKIRGFRIEPGEIESAIAESKLTKQSVVIAKADQSGSKRLIAYVVGNKMYQKQELLNYLRSKLPDYMIPSVIMELANIPLTANGKVDKRALPEVEHNQSKQYVAPSNEMQRQLCVIWQELLELKQVGITDNFFELGGHSLLAMRVISLVRRQLGIELMVKDLFKYPTIVELSKHLSRQKHGTLLPSIDKQERPAHIPLSFSQERLWFIDQLEGSIQYHIPAVLELKGKLNIEALNFGFNEIINRHEILRTNIVQHQGQAYQQIHANLEWQIEQIKDYKTQTQEELESSIKTLINQPYDLSKDSMLRAYLIERTDQDHILVVTLHHIVSDGWSTSIIVNELAELYRSFEQKVPVLLKTLQIQYADYAIWQRNYIQGELLDTKLAYWKQKLQNASPLELPTDYARPAVQGVRGLTEEFEIEASLTQQIKQLSQNSNTTVFMTLLSAFKVMLYRYTNQSDITIGTPIAGRQQLETESLIGYFVNTLALRSDISSQTKFSELLTQVRTTHLGSLRASRDTI